MTSITFPIVVLGGIAVVLATPASATLDYPSAWRCGQPAFAWYCDTDEAVIPHLPPLPPKAPPPPPPASKLNVPLAELQSARAFRERLEALQDQAIMSPTVEKVRTYIEAQELAMKKGAAFSDVWRRVVWADPALDYSQQRPVNATAVRAYEETRNRVELDQLRALAAEHGLLFFFRSDCPYCHALAPTLAAFARETGFEILPISVDGGTLPGFDAPTLDRGQAARLGVTRVPALYLAARSTGAIAPIGAGVISFNELAQRIVVLTSTAPGEQY